MKLNKIQLIVLLCGAPIAAHAGIDIGLNIGVPGGEVVIRDHPPEPRREVIGYPPGPGYVFIHGHWAWHHEHWEWIGGRWEAPRPNAVWIEGHWDNRPNGWVWVEGRWAAPQAQVVVVAPPPPPPPPQNEVYVVEQAPPPPPPEQVGPPPGPDFFYIHGRWSWQGRWVWVGGHYEHHRPGARFYEGHWDHHDGHYVWASKRYSALSQHSFNNKARGIKTHGLFLCPP